jgi:nitroreductase
MSSLQNTWTGSKPVLEVIRSRHSCRSFNNDPIARSLKKELLSRFEKLPRAPFGGAMRLVISDIEDKRKGPALGTYGVIRGAKTYLIGAIGGASCNVLPDFGYCFEWAILQATELGLGSCWLGGTFKRDAFSEAAQMNPGELVAAVSPLGTPSEKLSLLDRGLRFVAGSRARKPWEELFFTSEGEKLRPLDESRAGNYAVPLEMLRLAPSASNRQPWRIVRREAGYDFYLKRTPGYRALTPVDLQLLDIGIGMAHFELAASETGLKGEWSSLTRGSGLEDAEYVVSWMSKTDV